MAKKSFFPEVENRNNFSSGISTYVDWEPRTNIIQSGEWLIVEVELPGVRKEDVSISLEKDNLLVIRGTKHQPRLNENNDNKVTYYLFEREFGSFYKRIVIDFPLDVSKIDTIMENGVLTMKFPKKKSEKISVEIK